MSASKMILIVITLALTTLSVSCGEKQDVIFTPPVVVDSTAEIPEVVHLLTKANESVRFELQTESITSFDDGLNKTINVDIDTKFQDVEGFGFAITGGSAQHLNEMSDQAKSELLNELFGSGDGQIGMSFIRISIGASDLDKDVFSYNDQKQGAIDIDQDNFSLAPDEEILIPLLKEILLINPSIKIMASPWSAPAWMKNNNSPKGGSLLTEYYDSYALYLQKYIEGMEANGISIDYLSIQNEPLHDGNNPSMYMTAEDQRDFIKNSMGPLFEENQIQTKVMVYDHNCDRPDYPLTILDDPDAKKYVDGSAFHLYAGDISALSVVRNAHPDKNVYFSEQWYGAPGDFSGDLKFHIREIVVGSLRNWSRSIIEWNLSSNSQLEPHTDGGCDRCLGGITIEGDAVKRNAGYYVMAHISKYVRPGSERLFTNYTDDLPNVAFVTPNQEIVLLVLNNSEVRQEFNVIQGDNKYTTALDPGSVSTYVWPQN